MKMRLMAENMKKMSMSPTQAPQPYYPSFSVDLEQLPQAKNWKVGEEYTVQMKVMMSGSHMEDNGRRQRYDFKMKMIGAEGKDE